MPKITDEPLEAIQLRLFKSDLDYLRALFRNNIGVNHAMRNIIRSYVRHARERADHEIDAKESAAQAAQSAASEPLQ